jgi:hypothetical protein
MIVRAVSSSDDDEEDTVAHSVFSPTSASPQVSSSSLSTSTAVKLAWLGTSVALIALLLLDLAALLNQFFPAPNAVEQPSSTDPFTVVAWISLLWRERGVTSSFQPATVLNNLLGQLFVCAWIFARETALTPQRQRSTSRRRHKSINLLAWILGSLPWVLVVAVLCLGHLASCGYVLFALFESHGVRTKFWLGRSSAGSRTAPRV